MAHAVEMPELGFDMKKGTIVRWLKRQGDEVKKGEPLVEIETEKVAVEVEARQDGVLLSTLVPEGAEVAVGEVIAYVAEAGEQVEPSAGAVAARETPGPAAAAEAVTGPPSRPGAPLAQARVPAARILASLVARRLAEERGIDLAQVRGSGPGGRIVKRDVLALISAAPPAALKGQELPPMRQAIARLVTASKQQIPHFYVTAAIEMDEAVERRREINRDLPAGVKVSLNDMLVKAAAMALVRVPQLNAWYQEGRVLLHQRVNIGIAVATEQGLIVPIICDCQEKSLVEIARRAAELVARVRRGRLSEREYCGGTFTISNLGMYQVESFTAIVHPPQVAILAVGRVEEEPVVREGQVQPGRVMRATLSCDHRAVDGVDAAHFLAELKKVLEAPALLVS